MRPSSYHVSTLILLLKLATLSTPPTSQIFRIVANGMEDYSNTSFAFVNIVGMGGVGKLPDKSAPCSSLFQHLGGPKTLQRRWPLKL